MSAPFLRVAGVTKRFGSAEVLRDVHLDIAEGEFVCLLGPSGCGKTTLLRILCGIDEPTAGAVWLQGADITRQPTAQRRFGVVFQSYALFPNLTAADNVAYGLSALERHARRAKALEMLGLVGLETFADRYPAQLSGGQQQRVALARALAPGPRLLLLDEPLSALDAKVRHNLRAEIRRIQRLLGIPAVMVTHDQDEALAMADRVVLMNAGRIEQAAAPTQLYARPSTEFAARFVGRINLWEVDGLDAGIARRNAGQIRLNGQSSPAPLVQPLLGIRPERVRVLKGAEQVSGDNVYPAHVSDWTFCGAYVSLRVVVPQLNLELDAETASPADGQIVWTKGESCHVVLPPHELQWVASTPGEGMLLAAPRN
jgi:iron(III) transport system ATP-binding protein